MPKLVSLSTDKDVYLGIDPGKNGGFAVIKGQTVEWFPMPETERDTWDLIRQFSGVTAGCCIERIVPNLWGKAKSSVAKLYANYMALRMALVAAGIPFDDIRPVEWIRALGISPRKKSETPDQWKNRLRAKAQQLFPTLSLWKEPKYKQLQVCDAILLADFCRRRYERRP